MLKLLKSLFHFHDLIEFRIGRWPLVAAYCKCGCIKYGNGAYYDGSTYQKTLRGNDAIEFIQEEINRIESKEESIKNMDKIMVENQYKDRAEMLSSMENDMFLDYESIEKYNKIKEGLRVSLT